MTLTEFHAYLNSHAEIIDFRTVQNAVIPAHEDDIENKEKWKWERAMFFQMSIPVRDTVLNYKIPDEIWQYIEQRYNTCQCLFAKVVYGVHILYGEQLTICKDNRFKLQLLRDLQNLLLAMWPVESNASIAVSFIQYFPFLDLALELSTSLKQSADTDTLLQQAFRHHQEWDLSTVQEDTLRVALDLTALFTKYYKLSKNVINIQDVLDKNDSTAMLLAQSYLYGAIYVEMNNLDLVNKDQISPAPYCIFIGQYYEKMAAESDNMTQAHYNEAMRYYKKAHSDVDYKRAEQSYMSCRGKIVLTTHYMPMPDEYNRMVQAQIEDMIVRSDKQSIYDNLMALFPLRKWNDVIEQANRTTGVLELLATNIPLDKYGNVLSVPTTPEEKLEANGWNTYSQLFQLDIQNFKSAFLQAHTNGLISFDSMVDYLSTTWIGQTYHCNYLPQGNVDIIPLDNLRPVLRLLFDNLKNDIDTKSNLEYHSVIVDSLTLKVEYLLRYLCRRWDYSTCKLHSDGKSTITMEKLLDDLLQMLLKETNNFSEEVFRLHKFILTPKGYNFRNSIAHGMVDPYEYGNIHFFSILFLILVLSRL